MNGPAVGKRRVASVAKLRPAPTSESARVLPVAVPVIAAGMAAAGAAAAAFAMGDPSLAAIGGLLVLLVASCFAEAFPVPLEPGGVVTLAAVFIVGAAVTYDWRAAVIVAFLTAALVDAIQRRPAIRVAYNGANYALSGLAAGLAAELLVHEHGHLALVLEVLAGAAAFNVVNLLLNGAVIARWTGDEFGQLLVAGARETWAPFAIMASVSLMLAVLWEQTPLLAGALVGPLVAVALYQRSVHKAMDAMRLALTDPHTGLGNKRHFEELLQRHLDRADEEGSPLTLCLIDVDDFKAINDTYGHPAGDRALAQVAARLRRGGESFRLGGDEFALILPDCDSEQGRAIATAIARRIANAKYEHGGRVSVSVGVVTYPEPGIERSELVRVADKALYSAKADGKARVRVYRPDARPSRRRAPDRPAERGTVLRAAAVAAHAAVARDSHIGTHSSNVGELAARIAHRLRLDPEQIELIRLAGSLHDIGKLLVAQHILQKPAPLSEAERVDVERHAEIGHRMLEAIGLEPVATWVLHHHERWDGEGYPAGLAGEEIPLAARILFVADSYDTMTTNRAYRNEISPSEALNEVERCAGSQFDPDVVAALREELADVEYQVALPASA